MELLILPWDITIHHQPLPSAIRCWSAECPPVASYQVDTLKLKWDRNHGLSSKIGQETSLSNFILYSFRKEVQEWKEWKNIPFRSLACSSPRGHKESDMTEWLNWTEKNENPGWQGGWEYYKFYQSFHKIKCSNFHWTMKGLQTKTKHLKYIKNLKITQRQFNSNVYFCS